MQVMKKKERIKIYIDDIVYGGNGISKQPQENRKDFVIFVKNAITGQTVLAEITKLKSNYAEAKIFEVITKSELQKKRNYQKISGAPYYELDIKYQRLKKKALVFEVFQKIGKINDIEKYYDGFIHSPKTWHYRNKMEYAFSSIIYDFKKKRDIDEFGLGFKRANTWWMVENLEKDSGLFDKQWENSLHKIRKFCKETGLPAWNIPQKKGFFRNLNVRKSYKHDKLLVELVTSSNDVKKFNITLFKNKILKLHPNRIEGIIHTINDNISDRINYNDVLSQTIVGTNKITEAMLNLEFEIYMSSFFQTNPLCAQKLYKKVIEYSSENKHNSKPIILDLFCGTGTIAQMIASKNKNAHVIGVDIASSSIQNAIKSATKNKIKNVEFYNLDIGDFLTHNPNLKNKINTIIVDPPRPGIAKKSIKKIIELNSQEIIYVSCNPSTQARDIEILMKYGYVIKKFSIADQFPHTHHIETIFILVKSTDNVSLH
ncbi:MAG: 23S rRNA (uracil(1939)-C(5))-methyltransferase RlmD [Flavobacteriales bacterium TMED191]|nr:MAG: 23S rRNA (uracil(1939)-C(5))-methyltransferase RlmD [Flavobacteriales bacterium TMED191]